jgi:Transcriptional regulator, AbiEi antitoxin
MAGDAAAARGGVLLLTPPPTRGRSVPMTRRKRIDLGRWQGPNTYDHGMADDAAWSRLRDLAAGQFGLFTTVQARSHNIARQDLARRTQTGELFRAHHGVYGFSEDSASMFRFVGSAVASVAPGR